MFFVLEIMAFEFVSKCANCNGYLLSAVNELTKSLKVTNQTNKDFFQFKYIPNSWKNKIIVVPC